MRFCTSPFKNVCVLLRYQDPWRKKLQWIPDKGRFYCVRIRNNRNHFKHVGSCRTSRGLSAAIQARKATPTTPDPECYWIKKKKLKPSLHIWCGKTIKRVPNWKCKFLSGNNWRRLLSQLSPRGWFLSGPRALYRLPFLRGSLRVEFVSRLWRFYYHVGGGITLALRPERMPTDFDGIKVRCTHQKATNHRRPYAVAKLRPGRH
jgi:hypothetical protein